MPSGEGSQDAVSRFPATQGRFGLSTCTYGPLGPCICPGFYKVNCSLHRCPPAPTHLVRCGRSIYSEFNMRPLCSRFPGNRTGFLSLFFRSGHCTPPRESLVLEAHPSGGTAFLLQLLESLPRSLPPEDQQHIIGLLIYLLFLKPHRQQVTHICMWEISTDTIPATFPNPEPVVLGVAYVH